MLYGIFAIGCAVDGEEVELRLKTHVVMTHVSLGGTRHMGDFRLRYSFKRVCITIGACFYLCKNHHSVATCYYVDFKMPHTPVALYNLPAFRNQFVHGELFAPFTQRVMSCHYLFQNEGVSTTSTVNISRRPTSIKNDNTHFARPGNSLYEPSDPVIPAPNPVFDRHENVEKNESTRGTPHAVSVRPPPIISSMKMHRKAKTFDIISELIMLPLIFTEVIDLG